MRFNRILSAPLALLVSSTLSFAAPVQTATLVDGYQQGATADLSDLCSEAASFASFRDGSYLAFDGTDVDHRGASGVLLRRYAAFPFFSFPSFVILNEAETAAYFGESSNGAIYEVDLLSGSVTEIANLTFNFDMAIDEAAGVGYVSAATGMFGFNSVHRIDLATYQTTEVVSVTGFSGPLTTDAAGDVLLAWLPDTFPFPPGATNILRFDAADALGTALLSDANATLEVASLNGLSSLTYAEGGDQLIYTETNSGASTFDTILWKKLAGSAPEQVAELAGFTGGAEVTETGTGTWFGPYQPNHVSVSYVESDCFVAGTIKRVSIRGLRPDASFDGPSLGTSGQAAFEVSGLPLDGFVSLWLARSGALNPMDTIVDLGGTYPIALRASESDFGRRFPMIPLVGTGTMSLPFFQDAIIEGGIMAQWIVFDSSGTVVTSSDYLINRSPF